MRVGLSGQLHQDPGSDRPPPWSQIREAVRSADAAGLDSYWVYDHLLFRDGAGTTTGIHEAWTILSAIAACTEQIALGTLVLCTAFRNPALLAKMAVTADPFDEEAHLALVSVLIRAGRHGEARRRYGVYADRMAEIGVEASAFPVPVRDTERANREKLGLAVRHTL